MKKVAIYGQSYAVNAEKEVVILLHALHENNTVVFFEKNFYAALKKNKVIVKKHPTFEHFNDLDPSFEMLFTMGGDGTFLRAITYVRDLNIPILGINTGRLGFLATVPKDAIKEAILLLFEKKYTLQERTLLMVKTAPENKEISEVPFALNELTIGRKNTTAMIGVKTHLNNEYLNNYWADGLIVATPTGSTGYSLSCNGPVILPNAKNLVITPIAPHNLNARPMVIADNTSIQLEVDSRDKDFSISIDSRITSVSKNTKIFIEKAPFTIKSILFEKQSFLETLRSKLLWGEDTRNKPNI